MKIFYKTDKLQSMIDDDRALVRKYGAVIAKAVKRKINTMESMPHLKGYRFIDSHLELLESDEIEYSVRLDKKFRLIFSPCRPIPLMLDGGVDEEKVVEILIRGIVDYH